MCRTISTTILLTPIIRRYTRHKVPTRMVQMDSMPNRMDPTAAPFLSKTRSRRPPTFPCPTPDDPLVCVNLLSYISYSLSYLLSSFGSLFYLILSHHLLLVLPCLFCFIFSPFSHTHIHYTLFLHVFFSCRSGCADPFQLSSLVFRSYS